MIKHFILYSVVLGLFGSGIVALVLFGKHLDREKQSRSPSQTVVAKSAAVTATTGFFGDVSKNLNHPLSKLFIEVLVIVAAARCAGFVARKMGQPEVIGEIAAGILLGPSLLGWSLPSVFHFVFPESSFGTLRLLSQVGVCLFMFSVGLDLDLTQLKGRAPTAVVVSHVGIVFPYFLGVLLSLFLFVPLAPANTSFLAFALFIGIAMSITAFPVLARILEDKQLSKTPLGATAITCAAVDDVTAWSLLAFVVGIVNAASVSSALITVVLAGAFSVAMIFGSRPLLRRTIPGRFLAGEAPTGGLLAAVLMFTFASALFTEVIGVHALFGAFLAGLVMPNSAVFRNNLRDRLEKFSAVFLLPLFFAFTGLRTEIRLLNDVESWLICFFIIAVATLGKLGGSMLAARWTGLKWKESFMLGALMNTRGLMELIALNIGYDLGILSPRIFAMMVVMALVTTMMTGPLLDCAMQWARKSNPLAAPRGQAV
jgi:Kef-type K+ transport system membrane component KefB